MISDADATPTECVHPIDHKGTSRLCLKCQRAKDLRESDARAAAAQLRVDARIAELREFVRRGQVAQEAIDRLLAKHNRP